MEAHLETGARKNGAGILRVAGAAVFYLYAGAAFFYSQYMGYIYVTFMPRYSLMSAVVFLLLAVVAFLIAGLKPNVFYALSLIPAAAGTVMFYNKPLDFMYYLPFSISVVILYLGFLADSISKNSANTGLENEGRKYRPVLWAVAAVIFAILAMFVSILYIKHLDSEILWFFPMRYKGYEGSMNWYDGVHYEEFAEYSGLVAVAVYAAAVFLFCRFYSAGKIKKEIIILPSLVLVAFAGKIVLTFLTTQGIEVIPAKMSGPLLSAYYFWANRITDVSEFIANYVTKYQNDHNASHIKGHPIMPVMFYWVIINFISKSALVAGLIYSFITALGVIPFYYLGKHLTKSAGAGFFAALFYALTPNSLVLSVVGTDGMIAFLIIVFLALAVIGSDKGSIIKLVSAGIAFGMCTYFNFGVWPLLMFVFFSVLKWERLGVNREGIAETVKWVRSVIAVMFGIAAVHFICWHIFGGKYDYIASFNKAKEVSVGMMLTRAYEAWSWINFVHWAQYITAPVLGLFFLRYFRNGSLNPEAARFSIMAVAVVAVQFLGSLGRAETHRMYMYLIAFVIPVAVMPLFHKRREGNDTAMSGQAGIIAGFILVYSVALQVLVADLL